MTALSDPIDIRGRPPSEAGALLRDWAKRFRKSIAAPALGAESALYGMSGAALLLSAVPAASTATFQDIAPPAALLVGAAALGVGAARLLRRSRLRKTILAQEQRFAVAEGELRWPLIDCPLRRDRSHFLLNASLVWRGDRSPLFEISHDPWFGWRMTIEGQSDLHLGTSPLNQAFAVEELSATLLRWFPASANDEGQRMAADTLAVLTAISSFRKAMAAE